MRYSAVVAAMLVGCLRPVGVAAQVCGDADGSGTVTVTDGVAVLRAAAELASPCSGRTCDVDGSGAVSVTDGVGTLRTAAQLATPLSCGTRFGELVKTVSSGAAVASLRLGQPPASTPGGPSDVVAIEGDTEVRSGAVANVIVHLLRTVGSLLIGFRENGAFVDGFAQLTLPESTAAGSTDAVALQLDIADVPGGTTVELSVATTVDGQVGGFVSQPITVVADNAPVISGLDVSLSILNDVSFCAGPPFSPSSPGSKFVARFAYSDSDGDVTDAAAVTLSFRFSPSGVEGSAILGFRDIVGTPTSGTIDALLCYRFGTEVTVDSTVTLTDAAGNVSNAVTTTTGKPAGAN